LFPGCQFNFIRNYFKTNTPRNFFLGVLTLNKQFLTETAVAAASAIATITLAGTIITLVLISIHVGALSALILTTGLCGFLLVTNIGLATLLCIAVSVFVCHNISFMVKNAKLNNTSMLLLDELANNIELALYFGLVLKKNMSQNNRNLGMGKGDQGSPAKEKGQGSGQQTAGERGQKREKRNEEHYRSSDQKRQRGNHGGNR